MRHPTSASSRRLTGVFHVSAIFSRPDFGFAASRPAWQHHTFVPGNNSHGPANPLIETVHKKNVVTLATFPTGFTR
jgi:hypothetical protein